MAKKKIYVFLGHPNKEGTLSSQVADVYEQEAKTAGHDPAKLTLIAKVISDGKSGNLRLKLESTLDILDELESA